MEEQIDKLDQAAMSESERMNLKIYRYQIEDADRFAEVQGVGEAGELA